MISGIVVSSGGSALDEIARISGNQFLVISDRECGAEEVARKHGFECIRIDEKGRDEFSAKTAETLISRGCDSALLFFSRLVSASLFDAIPVFNIHPAALPLFPGLHGVEDAHAARSHLLGCTLHRVDETIDGGAIITQTVRAVSPGWPLARWNKIAYLMKVYCGLVWCAKDMRADYYPTGCTTGIPGAWGEHYDRLQRDEGEVGAGFSRQLELIGGRT